MFAQISKGNQLHIRYALNGGKVKLDFEDIGQYFEIEKVETLPSVSAS